MNSSEEEEEKLHIFLFPFLAFGHMIPVIDIAKLFAARGAKTTLLLTTRNASIFSKSIELERSSGLDIHIQILRFPFVEAGLPAGIENIDDIHSPEVLPSHFAAIQMLQEPLEQLLEEHRPDFIIADMFLSFASEAAGKYGIPRFIFNGTGFFPQCVEENIIRYKPHEGLASDREAFVVPGLPDKIEMTRLQLVGHVKANDAFSTEVWDKIREAEESSYGTLVNSFCELEPDYAMHFKNVLGKRAWSVGPASLGYRKNVDKTTSTHAHSVLNWLDKKEPHSVLYICFGSMYSILSKGQWLELAAGLENSNTCFIWVIKTINKEEDESYFPEGFEDRMEGKGLIIRDWAPQVLILNHPAVGGFMTHCGWNSTLEGVTAGVPMITWPMCSEQFYNEKFITHVLKIGIRVGAEKWRAPWTTVDIEDVAVKKEKIANVVIQLMGDGEEAINMRMRVKRLSEMAKEIVEEGGSSYQNLTSLIEMFKKPSVITGPNISL